MLNTRTTNFFKNRTGHQATRLPNFHYTDAQIDHLIAKERREIAILSIILAVSIVVLTFLFMVA